MSANPSHFSLYKRAGGVFHITYLLHGRRHWKSTGAVTRREALRSLSRFQELLEVTPRPVLVSEFVADFIAYARTAYSPSTLEIYERVLPRFAKLAGNVLLVEVTAEHFDRYKAMRLEAVRKKKNGEVLPTSPVSVNIELRAIRAAFNTAKRWQLVEASPFECVSLVPVAEQAPPFLTVADFERFLGLIKEGWFRDVVLFAVLTGLRRGEILNLRWQNVDLGKRLLNIETGPTFKTKNGRTRTIPMNGTAVHLLRCRSRKSASEYVFTLNGKPILEDWVTHLFKRYVRDLGLDGRLHFHSMRHTFASWLVQKGATLYEVQRLLGHSSSSVTELYSHLQPEQMHSTVNKVKVSLN